MPPKREFPLWKGPSEDGITQSLIGRYLSCTERFRKLVVYGLKPADKYENRMEYGNMWHCCEETFAAAGNPIVSNPVATAPWASALKKYAQGLLQKYRDPNDQLAIEKAWNCIMVQFPIYIEHWKKHPDVKQRTPLFQEQVFDVPYQLPSGRILRLKGKWDSVDLIGPKKSARVYLQENKTKSDIVEVQIKRQLMFDLQTMLYYVALDYYIENIAKAGDALFPQDYGRPAGVRYNVVRRPLAGGRHSIRPHQATSKKPTESNEAFYARLSGLIKEDVDYFFMRWSSEISHEDVLRFRQRFLDPFGERLCNWWEYMQHCNYEPWKQHAYVDPVTKKPGPCILDEYTRQGLHLQHPFGVYNQVNEVGYSDLDENIFTGSELGLVHTDNLFPELS